MDISEATRLLRRASGPGVPAVLWRFPSQQSRAMPCLSDGSVWVGGWGPRLHRLSEAGVPRWDGETPVDGEPVRLAAAPSGAIHAVGARQVEALDADGTRRWLAKPSKTLNPACAVGPEGQCYVTDKLHLYALDPRDGEVLWTRSQTPARREAPPTIGPDGTIHYVTANDALIAFAPDGREKWRYDQFEKLRQPIFGDLCGEPAVDADGNVYLQTRDGFLRKLDARGVEAWSVPAAPPSGVESRPALDGQGNVYACSGHSVVSVDAHGKPRWTRPLDDVAARVVGNPLGGVVVSLGNGGLRGLDVDGAATWGMAGLRVNGEPIFGPHGILYVGTGEEVLALAPLDAYQPPVPQKAGTVEQHEGWIVVNGVRVPVRPVGS